MKILGIDPGIGICGFGLIENDKALDYGVVTTVMNSALPGRLKELYESLNQVFDERGEHAVIFERTFLGFTFDEVALH